MANEIIIAGERFRLAAEDITVVTYEDIGSFSFPAKKNEVIAKMGIPPYGDRIVPGKGKIKTAERLKEEVHQIVLHTDLTKDAAGCFRALLGRGLSTHFMIDWDGTIYQTLDVMYAAYHAGDANNGSIGVDLNNRMPNLLKKTGEEALPYDPGHERYAEMSKKEFRRPKSGVTRINGAKVQSYGYTDAQYLALIELIKELSKHFKKMKKATAPFDAKGDIIPKVLDDFAGFNGFLGHFHISPSRWDPGPGFDWQRVFHALGSEHNSFPIELDKGKNIRTLLVPDKVKEYAERYYENAESNNSGWYPIGINQTWHGGIHLRAPCKDKVRAMFDGTLVAARFSNQPTKLGHNNFMLLRHSVPIPGKSKKAKPKEFIFYSLYMHLLPVETDAESVTKESLKWLKAIHRLDTTTEEAEENLEGEPPPEGEEGVGDTGEEVFEDEDEQLMIGNACERDPVSFDKSEFLGLGNHVAALKKGQIALIEYEDRPIEISSGEVIGRVGYFGPKGEWQSQIHVEVFADPARNWKEAIDIGIHGRYLVELDDDVGKDLFIENRDIVGLFTSRTRRSADSLVPQKLATPSQISGLFNAAGEFVEEKGFLRRAVTRHVSEWSDQVDWVGAISEGESWDDKVSDFRKILRGSALGQEAIATVLPWIWLSKDVAAHIGLSVDPWNGVLDHFHPIQFLIWLTYHSTQRIQVVSSGKSKKQLKKALEEEQLAIKEERLTGERAGYGAEFFAEEEFEGDAGTVLEDWFLKWDQGEWKRSIDGDEDEY